MKKLILLLLTLSMTVFTSCEVDDIIVDWAPVCLYLKVTDGQGTDLLDPENPKNMIYGTTITFKGETYEAKDLDWSERYTLRGKSETRAILAIMHGLRLVKDKPGVDGYSLVFGEIDGAADMDEDLVVTLPNGMTGTIHYHCSNHNERKLKCDRNWKLNGEKTKSNVFTFIVSE